MNSPLDFIILEKYTLNSLNSLNSLLKIYVYTTLNSSEQSEQ